MKQPTKEQVLKAAEASPEAKKALQKLWPEAFELRISQNTYKEIKKGTNYHLIAAKELGVTGVHAFLHPRVQHNLAEKGFFLGTGEKWKIVKDSNNMQVLVPTNTEE